ncbi:MAG: CAP domain-containing protein [Robiginitomaculum sp.]|nr:CAP domain-containing protein [Robiginitomaculum sp.]
MLRRTWIFGILLTALAVGVSVSLYVGASATNKPSADDGTYRETIVKSFEECTALCKADSPTCRAVVSVQPDRSKPLMICRLNNGFGANPLFPSTPPIPLDVNIAVADLNAYRRLHGLGPMVLNNKLTAASQAHAKDLAVHGTISHSGTDGSNFGERMQRQGYYSSVAAENVATGQKSWAKVFQAWKDSPGHNVNLLRDDVTDFGIALVYEPKTTYQTYWAMVVAAPFKDMSRYPYPISAPTGKTN